MHRNTDWLRNAKWGLFFHYLDSPASHQSESATTSEEWNARIDSFDVESFANQVEATGAGYIGFTLGQNSGHYCSPNAAYDSFVGISPSKCSSRDLVLEIATALEKKGIKTLAYFTSGAPDQDPIAVEKLQWKNGHERLAEFQPKWEAVIREWSLRWGDKIAGWWLDGCYFADAAYRHAEAPNFDSFNAALRAGNPNAIVAFNPGLNQRILTIPDSGADYTAGEVDFSLPLGNVYYEPQTADWKNGFVNGERLHVFTFLGNWWGAGAPRFPDEFVVGYTKHINAQNGAVTWDVPLSPQGEIPAAFMVQCAALKNALE